MQQEPLSRHIAPPNINVYNPEPVFTQNSPLNSAFQKTGREAQLHEASLPSRSATLNIKHARPPFYPTCAMEAAERIITVKDMMATGELSEEVARIGINPEWLGKLHAAPPYVGIAEQLMPLPTLFGKLGSFGKPEALRNAIQFLGDIAREVSYYSNQTVSTGLFSSPDHMASRTGITSGFYFLLPNFRFFEADRDRRADSKLTKIRLLPKRQLEQQDGLSYRELTLRVSTLHEISNVLHKETEQAERRVQTAIRRYTKQAAFNSQREEISRKSEDGESSHPVDRDMYQRERSYQRALKRDQVSKESLETLADLWDDCVRTCTAGHPESPTTSYWNFVSEFNTQIAKRICPDISFSNVSTEHIDDLATTGVKDWHTFLGALIKNDLIREGESILRYITPEGKHTPLVLKDLNELSVFSPRTHTTYSIPELVSESQKSLELTGAPRLLPIAVMRYCAAFLVGNGMVLDDGMPYGLYKRLYAASIDGDISLRPRGLLVAPYTDLSRYSPKNPLDPYGDMVEKFDILPYLRTIPKAS